MVTVYYDIEYLKFVKLMPKDNNFITFELLSSNNNENENENENENIYILNSNKTYNINSNNIIIIDYTTFDINNEIDLKYNINKVYLYFYDTFVINNSDKTFIISHNIYNKILNLINKKKYKIKYPIVFDAIETYLKIILDDISFLRIGDGELTIPNGGFSKIISEQIYNNSINVLNENYNYDHNKLVICYNEIYYNGYNMIKTKRNPNYWNENSVFFSLQQKYQNNYDIYYSSHCFRLNKHLNNFYSRFNIINITKFLSKMFKNKNIIIINSEYILDPFYNYKSRIDICYGYNSKYKSCNCITQKTTDFVLTTLSTIINNNPEIPYNIFVKGACLSNLIVNMYYKKYRVFDIGSFNLIIDKTKKFEQKESTVYYIK